MNKDHVNEPRSPQGNHTPETAAAALDYGRGRSMGCVSVFFAQTLEAERDALKALNAELVQALERIVSYKDGENMYAEARDVLAKLAAKQ